MKLKLKEEPKEWLKFTAVMALAAGFVSFLLFRRRIISLGAMEIVIAGLAVAFGVCALRPRWFRGFYRTGMTISWHVGQVMGRVLLTVFFLIVVTPMGLLLRLLGKDLLALKRDASAKSYWRATKTNEHFDRQF